MAAKNKGGRPSTYKPEYVQMLLKYLEQKPTFTKTGAIKKANFPSLVGFAILVGVHRDTLHEWTKEHEEFSDAYKKARDYQENYLTELGLADKLSTPFAIFTAKNVIGWRDKQPGEDAVVHVNNYASKSDEELDARINELMEKNKKVKSE